MTPSLRDRVIEVLRTVYDPEIPVNIYDLGLVYELRVDANGVVDLEMTLTAPACPAADAIVEAVDERVTAIEGVARCDVRLVWDPPWSRDLLSDEAKLQLGLL